MIIDGKLHSIVNVSNSGTSVLLEFAEYSTRKKSYERKYLMLFVMAFAATAEDIDRLVRQQAYVLVTTKIPSSNNPQMPASAFVSNIKALGGVYESPADVKPRAAVEVAEEVEAE
tara:strand:+ start:179 stop:523 length:345 start_codon:yes stop_codon:yes gene_type:complete